MPVSGSGVILPETTVPAVVANWRPPAKAFDSTGCPLSLGVWQSPQPPSAVTRYSPYLTLLPRSGGGTDPVGWGTNLINSATGKFSFVTGSGLRMGGRESMYATRAWTSSSLILW